MDLAQQVLNRFKFWDFIIIIVILLISVIIFLNLKLTDGNTVEIYVSGKLFSTYSLYENKNVVIPAEDGNITVSIENNKVHVIDSSCKDKNCTKELSISGRGQNIICLPLKVLIEIGGTSYEYAY